MKKVNLKHKKLLLIIAVLFGILLIIGVTYAYWKWSQTQVGSNKLAIGCLDIEFSGVNDIDLQDFFPITDEEGMQTTPYTFTIENTCSMDVIYQVNLETLNGSTLNKNYVATAIDNNNPRILASYNTVDKTINEAMDSKMIYLGNLSAGETVSHDLRIWLDYDTPNGEGMNQAYHSKVTIIVSNGTGQYAYNDYFWDASIAARTSKSTLAVPANEGGVIAFYMAYEKYVYTVFDENFNKTKIVEFDSAGSEDLLFIPLAIQEISTGYVVFGNKHTDNGSEYSINVFDTEFNLINKYPISSEYLEYSIKVISDEDGFYCIGRANDTYGPPYFGHFGFTSGAPIWEKIVHTIDGVDFRKIVLSNNEIYIYGDGIRNYSKDGNLIKKIDTWYSTIINDKIYSIDNGLISIFNITGNLVDTINISVLPDDYYWESSSIYEKNGQIHLIKRSVSNDSNSNKIAEEWVVNNHDEFYLIEEYYVSNNYPNPEIIPVYLKNGNIFKYTYYKDQ